MASSDTTADAERVRTEYFASLTGSERVQLAISMAEEAKAVAMAGIRARHPEWSAVETMREWMRLLHGDDIAARVG